MTPEEFHRGQIISRKYLDLCLVTVIKVLEELFNLLDELEKGHFINVRCIMRTTVLNNDFCRVIGVLVDYNLEEEAACLIDLMKHNTAEEELLPALKMLKNTRFEVFKKIQPLLQFFKDI